jgi:hypothetical protein
MNRRTGSSAAARYAPFLLVLAAQAILVAVLPSTGDGSRVAAFAPPVLGEGGGSSTGSPAAPVASGPTPASDVPGTTSGAVDTGGVARPGGPSATVGAAGSNGPQAAPSGDTSHCTPDGRQQGVTSFSPPCVPVFDGDNGGGTYKGVTGTEIRAVLVRNTYGAAVDGALKAAGLAASPEDEASTMADFGAFVNKRYEQYGREITWSFHLASCDMSVSVECARTEARTIVQKYDPFIVITPLQVLAEYHDELSKLGVVNVGGWHQSAAFYERLRPFPYDWFPDGTLLGGNIGSYFCQKMAGKKATLAGDPAVRAQDRKLAIIAPDLEDMSLVVGEVRRALGACGATAKDYRYSGGFDKSSEEFGAIVTQLRNDRVTTVTCLCDPIRPAFMTTAMTNQAYFPEHLISGMGAADHDYFGRLYDQTQWKNAFGPGIQQQPVAIEQQDDYKAFQDTGAEYRCYACLANFIWIHQAGIQIQAAGPNLDPGTLEQGTLSLPPMGGFANTGNALVPLVKFGAGDYTGMSDSMEVYWDPTATSEIDGKAGSYVCVQPDCRRYEFSTWPKGDAKKPT